MGSRTGGVALGASILGCVLGVLLGYWLTGDRAPVPANRSKCATCAPVSEAPVSTSRETAIPLPPEEKTSEPAPAGTDFGALLRRWDAEENVVKPPSAGEIRGRVLDENGSPAPGAELKLQLTVYHFSDSMPMRERFSDREKYLEALLRYFIRDERRFASAKRSVITSADGGFVFADIPKEGGVLAGEHPDGVLLCGGKTTVKAMPGDTLEFRLLRTAGVEVSVVSNSIPAGTGLTVLAHSTVNRGDISTRVQAEVGKTFTMRLPPGKYSLAVYNVGRESYCAPVEICVEEGKPTPAVTLTLRTRPRLQGSVTFEGARPLGCSVFAVRVKDGVSETELLDLRRERKRLHASLNECGDFKFSDVSEEQADEQFLVGVAQNHNVLAWSKVTIGADNADVQLNVIAPQPSACLVINLDIPAGTRRDGEPQFVGFSAKGNRAFHFQIWRVSNVQYRLTPDYEVTMGDADEDPLATLCATLPSLGSAVVAAQTIPGEVTFRFKQPVKAFLRVKNVPEELKREVGIGLFADDGAQSSYSAHQFVFKEGTFEGELGFVQPGHYKVRVGLGLRPDSAFKGVSMEVNLSEQTPTIEAEIPPLFEVKLDGAAIKPYTWAQLYKGDEKNGSSVHFEKDGTAVIPYLEAGQYTLKYRVERKEKVFEFTVTRNETMTLSP